jgi:hypothetical protein
VFKIREVRIHDDGTFDDLGLLYTGSTSLGVAQGMCCRDGRVYYLTDDATAAQSGLRRVTRFGIRSGALVADRTLGWYISKSDEAEGLTFHQGKLYFGEGTTLTIFAAPLRGQWSSSFVAGQIHIVGTGFSTERVAYFLNSGAHHTGVFVDAVTGQDSYVALGVNGGIKWDVRCNGAGSNALQFRTQTDNTVRITVDTSGRVSIGGTSAPVASAILDLSQSTTRGFLPPVVTTTQKNAISSPATGLVVYDKTLNKLCVYTGSAWETVTSS